MHHVQCGLEDCGKTPRPARKKVENADAVLTDHSSGGGIVEKEHSGDLHTGRTMPAARPESMHTGRNSAQLVVMHAAGGYPKP